MLDLLENPKGILGFLKFQGSLSSSTVDDDDDDDDTFIKVSKL